MVASAHNVTHNADSHRSRNFLDLHSSRLDVVSYALCTHQILCLTSLTKRYEFHLYYDI